MLRLQKAFILGLCAGVVDVVPMIAQGLDWYANTSALVQWIVMGIVITHMEIGLKSWLKGLIVAELCTIPIMIIVSINGILSIIPIAAMTAILGCCVGYIGERYIKK